MAIDLLRFWGLLIPPLAAYLVTDRSIKAIYLVPLAWFAVDLLRWRFDYRVEEKRILQAFLIYLLMAALALVSSMTQSNQKVLVRDILVIATPLLMFLNLPARPKRPGLILFLLFSLVYLFELYRRLGGLSLSHFTTLNLFLPSEVSTENNFGVVFGLFTLHFLMNRKWAWFGASLLLSIMVSKRALIVGLILGSLYWAWITLVGHGKGEVRKPQLLLLYLVLGIGAIFLVEIGQIALEAFGLADMGLARFLMGRDELLMVLRERSLDFSIPSFFGHGPGASDSYLAFRGSGWGALSDTPFNPHNDHMKLLYDYGYAGYLLFFIVLANFYAATHRGAVLLVYTMTVFCFDNSLIFIIYAIVAGFLLSEYRREERSGLDQ